MADQEKSLPSTEEHRDGKRTRESVINAEAIQQITVSALMEVIRSRSAPLDPELLEDLEKKLQAAANHPESPDRNDSDEAWYYDGEPPRDGRQE